MNIPGEAIFVPSVRSFAGSPRCIAQQIVPELSYSPDVFEYVYFARPESIMDGISVNRSRQLMGEELAASIMSELAARHSIGSAALDEIDCVVPVPETSYTCALALAQCLEKPLSLGLVRNRFIMRTFILPNQKQRCKSVNRKLNTVREEFDGKNVLIVDDSIVRGATAARIVKMAREAGAKKVYFASGSPPIRYVPRFHCLCLDLCDFINLADMYTTGTGTFTALTWRMRKNSSRVAA
jgi:amidophosphoribosyltransferase